MGVLNRKRHQVGDMMERLSEGYRQTPLDVIAEACRVARLAHRVVTKGGYVAVDAYPEVDFVVFTAIEPAMIRVGGWKVWYRHSAGVDRFRYVDPIEHGIWCRTVGEAIEVAARWQRSRTEP